MRRIVFLFALLLSHALGAAPITAPLLPPSAAQVSVHAPAEPWPGWAQENEEFRLCAQIAAHQDKADQNLVCPWPGVLQIQADADGARFVLIWQVLAESWVTLPGDSENWPQDVRVNNRSMPVVRHGNVPQLLLKPGNYVLAGRIGWMHRPQALALPRGVGPVRLQVDGRTIAPVHFDGGAVVLGPGPARYPKLMRR
ncbi:MAG TPA: hypothetical protein VK753_09855 [Xanthomonadaceae bacterium]|nr:hypothetical protein [Xanthomonadaceae bacterium]